MKLKVLAEPMTFPPRWTMNILGGGKETCNVIKLYKLIQLESLNKKQYIETLEPNFENSEFFQTKDRSLLREWHPDL